MESSHYKDERERPPCVLFDVTAMHMSWTCKSLQLFSLEDYNLCVTVTMPDRKAAQSIDHRTSMQGN